MCKAELQIQYLECRLKRLRRVLGEAKDTKIGGWRVCGNPGRGGPFYRRPTGEADLFSCLHTFMILRAIKV